MDVGLTQLVGSQSQHQILLGQPPFEVVEKRVRKRVGRGAETDYRLHFTGHAESEGGFISKKDILDASGGREALAAFENAQAPYNAGGHMDAESENDLDTLQPESMPGAPAQPSTQQPWTQQPNETQLPLTQQHFLASPGYDMLTQQSQEHFMRHEDPAPIPQQQAPYGRGMPVVGGGPSAAGPAHHVGTRIVNGLPSSFWEDPVQHAQRPWMQHHAPPAAAPGQHMSGQPIGTASGAQEGLNTWANLAAQSRQLSHISPGLKNPSLPAQPLQREAHCTSPHEQQQPQNVFAAFAAATRQSNASNAQGVLAPGQSTTLAGGHAANSSTSLPGFTLRQSIPQHQADVSDRSLPYHAETSFAFPPVNDSMPSQRPHHSHASPITVGIQGFAGQMRSEAARPVPASFHCTGMWAAQEQRLPGQPAAAAEPYPAPAQQQIGAQQASAVRHSGQRMPQMYATDAALRSTVPGAAAANPVGGVGHIGQPQPAPAQPSTAAYQGQHQPPAHEAPRGFYDTVVQSLSVNLPAASHAWSGAPAYRAPTPAHAPQEPSRAQEAASPTPVQSGAPSTHGAELRPHPVVNTAAPKCVAGGFQGPRPAQPEMQHWERQHSSGDAAETSDAVALAALEHQAAQLIRTRARPESATQPQGAQLPYISTSAWGAWAPAVNSLTRDRGTGQQREAAAPAGHEVEDPIEETPAPLQERPEPASQERVVPDRRSPLRQRNQLKRMYVAEQLPPEEVPSPQKLRRLVKKVAVALEQAARQEDSETGSSAERFNQQSARVKAEPVEAISDTLQNHEEEGGGDPAHSIGAGAAGMPASTSMPVPDSAAGELAGEDGEDSDDLQTRLSEKGWKGAFIRRAKHSTNSSGEDKLQLQIAWPDGLSVWVDKRELHMRPHTHLSLIKFYESKTKPK